MGSLANNDWPRNPKNTDPRGREVLGHGHCLSPHEVCLRRRSTARKRRNQWDRHSPQRHRNHGAETTHGSAARPISDGAETCRGASRMSATANSQAGGLPTRRHRRRRQRQPAAAGQGGAAVAAAIRQAAPASATAGTAVRKASRAPTHRPSETGRQRAHAGGSAQAMRKPQRYMFRLASRRIIVKAGTLGGKGLHSGSGRAEEPMLLDQEDRGFIAQSGLQGLARAAHIQGNHLVGPEPAQMAPIEGGGGWSISHQHRRIIVEGVAIAELSPS